MEFPRRSKQIEPSANQQKQMEIVVNDVTKRNFITIWPSMMLAIKTSTFIAVDLVG